MSQLEQKIASGSRIISGERPVERVVIGLSGNPLELLIYQGKIYVYNILGQTLIDGGFIAARAIAASAIIAEKLSTASRKFVHNIIWTATDQNTCSWSSGIIKFADGTTLLINAGNTGNIAKKNYIYCNGTSTLQKTEYYSSAIGGNNIPLAIIEPTTDPGGKCIITPFVSLGTTIDGDLILTGKIQSVGGQTYFDLNNNIFKVSDPIRARILIGKINSAYGIKVSLFGVDAETETDVNKFALWAMSDDATDNVLIKEKTRGSISVGASDNEVIAHGLGYVSFCLVFVEEVSGQYIKCYGRGTANDSYYYEVDDANLTLFNRTGSSKIFKYYIFYDQMSS